MWHIAARVAYCKQIRDSAATLQIIDAYCCILKISQLNGYFGGYAVLSGVRGPRTDQIPELTLNSSHWFSSRQLLIWYYFWMNYLVNSIAILKMSSVWIRGERTPKSWGRPCYMPSGFLTYSEQNLPVLYRSEILRPFLVLGLIFEAFSFYLFRSFLMHLHQTLDQPFHTSLQAVNPKIS